MYDDRSCVFVQFGDAEYEDPNTYPVPVKNGHLDQYSDGGVVVPRATAERWAQTCEAWALMQQEIEDAPRVRAYMYKVRFIYVVVVPTETIGE